MSNTKIVVTLGPSSDSPAVLRQMMAGGVSIFRLNTSHGSQPEHAARITAVRAIAAVTDRRRLFCSTCKARRSGSANANPIIA